MNAATTHRPSARVLKAKAEKKVRAEIESMLQLNGNSPTANGWVPRVVMMTYEIRCANKPDDEELAACYAVAKVMAGTN